jgi:hypothetical protein
MQPLTLAFIAIIFAGSGIARAAEGALAPIRLRYERLAGAESCPEESQLRDAIATRLGSDPFSDQGKRLLEIRIGAQGEWLEAHIGLIGENGTTSGQRDLRSRSRECQDLATVIVLTASMVLNPLTPPATEAAPPLSAAADEQAAQEGESVTATATTTPAGSTRSGTVFETGVALVGEVGSASAPSLGLALQLGLAWPLFSITLEGQANLPRNQTLTPGSVASSQITGSLVPCFTSWHLGACGLISAGATIVTPNGISPSGTQSVPFFGLGARVYGGLPLTDWLETRLQLDLLIPVTQTTIALDGTTEWTSSPVIGSAALALVTRFR